MPESRDFTFVAPERHDEVRRRIAAVEGFIAKPGRKAAEDAAAGLGLRVAQFYNLVGAWRVVGRPEAIAGSGRPRSRPSSMGEEQAELIDGVVAENARLPARELIAEVARRAREAGVTMPHATTIARHVRRTRPACLPDDLNQFDVIVDHTVLDLTVDYGEAPRRPLATIVIDVAAEAVVGLALSPGMPQPAGTAAAILDALGRSLHGTSRDADRDISLGIATGSPAEAEALLGPLARVGIEAILIPTKTFGMGRHAGALLASGRAGIRLLPRLVWNTGPRRLAPVKDAKPPLAPDVALELARARLLGAKAGAALGRLDDAAMSCLADGLVEVAREGHAA